jgi:hypothetical protein
MENEREPPPSYRKTELRKLMYGLRTRVTPTPGMKQCARHIPSSTSLAVTAKRVQATWKEVSVRIREDAVNQAWMAWKTNMQKVKKRREENPNAEIETFNLRHRKFSETSVINLPKREVVMKFVKAEKKVRLEKEEEQMEQIEQILSRSDERKKKQKEKKKRDRERRKQKRESARLLNSPPQLPPPRDENSPNKRVHFFAEFSQYGWYRNMKVAEENAPIKYGIQLCDSEKVVEQILENDCKNVVQTRLRYNPKTKEHFIDMIIKVPTTSEDKEGEVVVGGTDVGNTPLCTFYNGSTGIFLTKACWTKTVAEICSKKKKELPSWRSSSKKCRGPSTTKFERSRIAQICERANNGVRRGEC